MLQKGVKAYEQAISENSIMRARLNTVLKLKKPPKNIPPENF